MGCLEHNQRTLLITGSNGFLGRHIVRTAIARGHKVRAVVRSASSLPDEWAGQQNVTVVHCDLGAPAADEMLLEAMSGVDVVVHAAAEMSGDDQQHERNTIQPTKAIVSSLASMAQKQLALPELVLISSLSVYAGIEPACGSLLDEQSQ